MKTNEIRSRFLDFFKQNNHQIVSSSSLVPENDPSLLFVNSGMVQFKDVFLGYEKRDYNRATTSQRCVRAGGKHNDLENVGYTARHHTFFEMLGNFSFGDYFKSEAIQFAWDFLTKELGLPEEKLWVTVFEDDDEAAEIWINQIGVPKEKLARIGEKDNFWAMGNTGPCGPCTEIFYDHGPEVEGGPPGTPEEDGDRYIEIWNLVFMQYNRQEDGTLDPLPRPSVDTGMGLERVAAVLQHVHSNYEIDTFVNLINAAAKVTGASDLDNKSLRVIADHIRSTAFMIIDGVTPSNEGRGYVLRRIIRRAIRHGYQIGCKQSFMDKLVQPLVDEMGDAYPELTKDKKLVEQVLKAESERFAETLEQGIKILDKALVDVNSDQLDGDLVFKLYDTFGFPVDLTADIAREHDLGIDMDGFETCMQTQRDQARSASQFENQKQLVIDGVTNTDFTGYETVIDDAKVLVINQDGKTIDELQAGDSAVIILDQTPFYGESGGQVGDSGQLIADDAVFDVEDTQKLVNKVIGHYGKLRMGNLKSGANVKAKIDVGKRKQTTANHSATHLLHAALKNILGDHVNQKGSLVGPQRLRFDFSHFNPINNEELKQIESIVNQQIQANHKVKTQLMDLEQAKTSGAQALFGEKYENVVRVVEMGPMSLELCGGTHVNRTGEIGLFKITQETGVAAGIRRIEAVCGLEAHQVVNELETKLNLLAESLKVPTDDIEKRVVQLLEANKNQARQIQAMQASMVHQQTGDLTSKARIINNIKWLAIKTEFDDVKQLRNTVDQLKEKLQSGVVVLINSTEVDKLNVLVGVTTDLTEKYHAGKLVARICEQLGGKGGGKADFGQGGGSDTKKIESLLENIDSIL